MEHPGRFEEASDVVFQSENEEIVVVVVGPDSLEDRCPIVKGVGLYRNFGLARGYDLTVKPDVRRFLTQ